MAESLQLKRSIERSSDLFPENFCEPCYEVDEKVKQAAGYCLDCDEDLCLDCFSTHLRRKLFRNHKLMEKTTKPKTKPVQQTSPQNLDEECLLHHGETIQHFCQTHFQFCCEACLKINHSSCYTDKISKLARNIQYSDELIHLDKTLNTLKRGFNDTLSKTGNNEIVIQRNYSCAMNDMKKIRDKFDKLMNETELQCDKIKEEDFDKIENVSETCDIVIKQINKLASNLETLKAKGENKQLFIAMKRAESQLKSLEENLDKLDNDNTVREYKFEPNEELIALLNDFKVLGKLSFQKNSQGVMVNKPSISDQWVKKPSLLKDIIIKSSEDEQLSLPGSLVLSKNKILITDWKNKKLTLVGTDQDKVYSEIQVSGSPYNIARVNDDEVAVTVNGPPHSIQFITVFEQSLSKGRTISVNGKCKGISTT